MTISVIYIASQCELQIAETMKYFGLSANLEKVRREQMERTGEGPQTDGEATNLFRRSSN